MRVCDRLWIVSRFNGTQCPYCGAMPGEYHRERKPDAVCQRCGATREEHGDFGYGGTCPNGTRQDFLLAAPESPVGEEEG